MKKIVLLALLYSSTQAVKLDSMNPIILMAKEASSTMKTRLQAMDEEQLFKMVKDAVNAKNLDVSLASTAADPVAKDADLKAVESVLSGRILDRLKSGGYFPRYGYPLSLDLLDKIYALRMYHDLVLGFELENQIIAGLLDPSLDALLKILAGATDSTGSATPATTVPATTAATTPAATTPAATTPAAPTPAAKTLLQTQSEGVPVLVNPTLLQNTVGEQDLGQRNYIIEGVDGYEFVQTKSEGVPVLVNPTLLVNTQGEVDLAQRNVIIDGVDGFDFVQTDKKEMDDTVVLQVKGVPVLVNPTLMKDEVGTETFGNTILIGPNNVTYAQSSEDLVLNVRGKNVHVGQEELVQHSDDPSETNLKPTIKVGKDTLTHGLTGTEDLNENIINGKDKIHFASAAHSDDPREKDIEKNYPTVSIQKETITHGITGTEDLGQNIINGKDKIHYAQRKNPVENPPMNNWSVNQPSRTHDVGMDGKEELGMDMIVNGTPVHLTQGPYEDLGLDGSQDHVKIDGMTVKLAQTEEPVGCDTVGDSELGMNMTVKGTKISIAQKQAPVTVW